MTRAWDYQALSREGRYSIHTKMLSKEPLGVHRAETDSNADSNGASVSEVDKYFRRVSVMSILTENSNHRDETLETGSARSSKPVLNRRSDRLVSLTHRLIKTQKLLLPV